MGCIYLIDCQCQHRKQEIGPKSAYEIGICTTLPFVEWKFEIRALNIIVEWILVKWRYVQKKGPAKLTQWPTMVGVLIRQAQLTRLFTRPVCFELANQIQMALFGKLLQECFLKLDIQIRTRRKLFFFWKSVRLRNLQEQQI